MDRGVTYWYRVGWLELGAHADAYSPPVSYSSEALVAQSRLFPNPSRGPVTIEWTLAAPAEMDVRVYDLAGREIAAPVHGRFDAGKTHVGWDGRRFTGDLAAAGWYVVRVRGGTISASHRLLLFR